MWKDKAKDSFWWMEVRSEIDELLCELCKAEDEEEVGIYLLSLHFKNEKDLKFFTKKEIVTIKKLLSFLMSDTHRHRELLGEMGKELSELRRTKYA